MLRSIKRVLAYCVFSKVTTNHWPVEEPNRELTILLLSSMAKWNCWWFSNLMTRVRLWLPVDCICNMTLNYGRLGSRRVQAPVTFISSFNLSSWICKFSVDLFHFFIYPSSCSAAIFRILLLSVLLKDTAMRYTQCGQLLVFQLK